MIDNDVLHAWERICGVLDFTHRDIADPERRAQHIDDIRKVDAAIRSFTPGTAEEAERVMASLRARHKREVVVEALTDVAVVASTVNGVPWPKQGVKQGPETLREAALDALNMLDGYTDGALTGIRNVAADLHESAAIIRGHPSTSEYFNKTANSFDEAADELAGYADTLEAAIRRMEEGHASD